MKNLIICLLVMLGLSWEASGQFNRLPANEQQFVDDELQALIVSVGIKGAAVGIVVDGEIAYIKGAGLADVSKGISVNECTKFRTASICKPLGEILARILDTENPEFSVNDPVLDWLPNWSLAQNNPTITVLDLMNHTSGIDNYGAGWDSNAADNYWTDNAIYDAQKALDIVDQCVVYPQAQWIAQGGSATSLYSTANYMILGAVLEKVSGLTYQELMKSRYTDPLNMHTYQPEYLWMSYSNKCKGYDGTSGSEITLEDISYKLPGGGFLTSAADMALFIKAYTNDVIPDDNGGTLLSHTGSQPGTYTNFKCSKVLDRGVVLLSNTNLDSTERAAFNTALDDIYDEMNGLTSADLIGNAYSEAQTSFSLMHITGQANFGENKVYSASTITSGAFEAKIGSDVRCISDSKITLSPGFEIREGSYFVASIENVSGSCPVQPKSYSQNEEMTETGISETNDALEVYPNPTNGEVFIRSTEDVDEISIVDISGREIERVSTNESRINNVNMVDAPSGIYFVKFMQSNQVIDSRKLIVNH